MGENAKCTTYLDLLDEKATLLHKLIINHEDRLDFISNELADLNSYVDKLETMVFFLAVTTGVSVFAMLVAVFM